MYKITTLSLHDLFTSYESCCWVKLENAYPAENQGWRMSTEIDLNHVRPNGKVNSSPKTSPIPVQLFHRGCEYWFEIPGMYSKICKICKMSKSSRSPNKMVNDQWISQKPLIKSLVNLFLLSLISIEFVEQ